MNSTGSLQGAVLGSFENDIFRSITDVEFLVRE
jgi:hypothetical protein